jgi:hypothetical protein
VNDVRSCGARRCNQVLREGTPGGKRPLVSTPCECHYAGSLIDGTEFDSSYKRGSPTTFAPNQGACVRAMLAHALSAAWALPALRLAWLPLAAHSYHVRVS